MRFLIKQASVRNYREEKEIETLEELISFLNESYDKFPGSDGLILEKIDPDHGESCDYEILIYNGYIE